VSKKCLDARCKKIPTYGPPGTKRGIHCAEHRHPGDIDVISNICLAEGCTKVSSYGPLGTTERLYCVAHKRPEDVNLKIKRLAPQVSDNSDDIAGEIADYFVGDPDSETASDFAGDPAGDPADGPVDESASKRPRRGPPTV
jgi:hypothetical protein